MIPKSTHYWVVSKLWEDVIAKTNKKDAYAIARKLNSLLPKGKPHDYFVEVH